jgi:hypothetical protein
MCNTLNMWTWLFCILLTTTAQTNLLCSLQAEPRFLWNSYLLEPLIENKVGLLFFCNLLVLESRIQYLYSILICPFFLDSWTNTYYRSFKEVSLAHCHIPARYTIHQIMMLCPLSKFDDVFFYSALTVTFGIMRK